MASRKLDDLQPEFRSVVFEFLSRCLEAKIPLLIVETLRTQEEHEANLRNGRSWTKHSKHIDGLAIDVVPMRCFPVKSTADLEWNSAAPEYSRIGAIGKSLGLIWGGDWKQRDVGHFESGQTHV